MKPAERVLLLGEIIFEFRQLWVRRCQALCSIIFVPSGVALVDEFPAQNAEFSLKQVFYPRKKEKKFCFVFFSFFFSRLICILCSSRERMLFLKEI